MTVGANFLKIDTFIEQRNPNAVEVLKHEIMKNEECINEEVENLKILNENDHILKYIEDFFVNQFWYCIITEYCEVI